MVLIEILIISHNSFNLFQIASLLHTFIISITLILYMIMSTSNIGIRKLADSQYTLI